MSAAVVMGLASSLKRRGRLMLFGLRPVVNRHGVRRFPYSDSGWSVSENGYHSDAFLHARPQESVAGGQVVQARNNAIRIVVGLMIFGSAWLIYESLLVALFGTSQFSPGSFAGVGGLIYIMG